MEPKIEVHVTINAHNPQKMKQKAGNMRLRWVGRRRGAFGHGKCTSNTNSNSNKNQCEKQQQQRQCNNEIAYQLASNLRQWAAVTTDWLCSTSSFNPIRKTHVSASMLISNGTQCLLVCVRVWRLRAKSALKLFHPELWHFPEFCSLMWNNNYI